METGKRSGALGSVFMEEDGRSLPQSDVETHHQHPAGPPVLAQCSVLSLWLGCHQSPSTFPKRRWAQLSETVHAYAGEIKTHYQWIHEQWDPSIFRQMDHKEIQATR